jgi:hypothetical protein
MQFSVSKLVITLHTRVCQLNPFYIVTIYLNILLNCHSSLTSDSQVVPLFQPFQPTFLRASSYTQMPAIWQHILISTKYEAVADKVFYCAKS